MKNRKKQTLKLSKIAIAKINESLIVAIKGGTLPTSAPDSCQMSDAPDKNGICYALD